MEIHVFGYVRIRARWIGPLRLAECSQPISLVFATLSQSVSSRRGRFIAPAYMKTPTKWRTEMCVWWCGNVYLIMWKYVINNVEIRVRWNEYTYLMTWIHVFVYVRIRARWIGPLRLAGCFATNFVGVRHVIANRSSRISCVFVAHSLVEYYVFVK